MAGNGWPFGEVVRTLPSVAGTWLALAGLVTTAQNLAAHAWLWLALSGNRLKLWPPMAGHRWPSSVFGRGAHANLWNFD